MHTLDGTFCKFEERFFFSWQPTDNLFSIPNTTASTTTKSWALSSSKNRVMRKYALGNPAWHFKMWKLSISWTAEGKRFFQLSDHPWVTHRSPVKDSVPKLKNRVNYFQQKYQVEQTKKVFSLSLFRRCKLCFKSKDFSTRYYRKESRSFKSREPLKAIFKMFFFLRGSTELNEPSGLGRQSCWLVQPVGSGVTLELIHLHITSQSSSSTRCANGAVLPASPVDKHLHF